MEKEKNKKKSGKAGVILGVVAIIIALLTLGMFLYWYYTGELKGDPGLSIKGEPGYTPVKNVDYFDGKDGSSPAYEWKGTSIHFMNPDGIWGAFIDLKGSTGATGSSGRNGRDGRDAPINHPPEITNVNLSGYHNCYKHNISFTAYDADDDKLRISVSYSKDNTSWKQKTIEYGYSGDYAYQITTDYATIYWQIEVWDGDSIDGNTYEYTIE